MSNTDLISDIKMVLDISSRVDERVKMIQLTQQELSIRLHQLVSDCSNITARVSVLESKNGNRLHAFEEEIREIQTRIERIDLIGTSTFKVNIDETYKTLELLDEKSNVLIARINKLEEHNEGWRSKTQHYGHLLVQGIWVVIVCYVLYKLGINTPPIP